MTDEKSDDDLIPLEPLDEQEEARRRETIRRAQAEERDLLAELAGPMPIPLEHRENLSAEDLEHFVINYCLDLIHGQRERAQQHVRQLRRFGPLGRQAVEDVLNTKLGDPALAKIPQDMLRKFLRDLLGALHNT
jgi:hypothetical protein